MRVRAVTPCNVSSDFRLEELFFSTTNPKGTITSGNSVFVRVSRFTAEELIGEPHNAIRHPDMPRAVFRLLWQTIAAGRPIAAYVKNMAKDGTYYWVVALVVPVKDGYLSIRFKPSSPLLGEVEKLYARMRAVEKEHGAGPEAGRAGMDAAAQLMLETLRGLGHASYENFMCAFMRAEMKSRERGLSGRTTPVFMANVTGGAGARLGAIHAESELACGQIDRLYRRLDELAGFSERLGDKARFVTELTHDIRFVALSTSIKASKLGDAGSCLGVVASFLGEYSVRTASDVARLSEQIRAITAELEVVGFHLSGARLQVEMMMVFCRELAAGSQADTRAGRSRQQMIHDLQEAFAETAGRATKLLVSLGVSLRELGLVAVELQQTVMMLKVAQVAGLVEASRLQGDASVTSIFEDVRGQVIKTSDELTQLAEIAEGFAKLLREAPEIERAIAVSCRRIESHVNALESGPMEVGAAPGSAAPAVAAGSSHASERVPAFAD